MINRIFLLVERLVLFAVSPIWSRIQCVVDNHQTTQLYYLTKVEDFFNHQLNIDSGRTPESTGFQRLNLLLWSLTIATINGIQANRPKRPYTTWLKESSISLRTRIDSILNSQLNLQLESNPQDTTQQWLMRTVWTIVLAAQDYIRSRIMPPPAEVPVPLDRTLNPIAEGDEVVNPIAEGNEVVLKVNQNDGENESNPTSGGDKISEGMQGVNPNVEAAKKGDDSVHTAREPSKAGEEQDDRDGDIVMEIYAFEGDEFNTPQR